MNINEASGRSLDALVARHVFGLLVEPSRNGISREPEALYRLPSGDWVAVPFYSSLVSKTDEVVAKLQDLGWRVTGEQSADSSGAAAGPRIVLAHSDGRIVSATGRSFSQALCRAALMAVLMKRDKGAHDRRTQEPHDRPMARPIRSYYMFKFNSAEEAEYTQKRITQLLATPSGAPYLRDDPAWRAVILSGSSTTLYFSTGALEVAILLWLKLPPSTVIKSSELPGDLRLIFGETDDLPR